MEHGRLIGDVVAAVTSVRLVPARVPVRFAVHGDEPGSSPMSQADLFTKRYRKLSPPPEFNLHVMVADTLGRWVNPDWQYTHIASGEFRTEATARRLKRMGVKPGWPDFILLSPAGVPYFMELKRPGGKLSEHQAVFSQWCVAHGVAFAICDTYEGVLKQLKGWNVVRSGITIAA